MGRFTAQAICPRNGVDVYGPTRTSSSGSARRAVRAGWAESIGTDRLSSSSHSRAERACWTPNQVKR
ncbi:hypothetical protein D2E64_27145 [Mycobacteroides abscessus]|nr:hypothetical protein DDJ76_05370 [Mycobacteroides abscessus]RIS11418.1 hypothetical protein D2E63_05990 [Mycobacteroides abscessus]RIS20491.1 hypothetical protein D2E69_05995 [Mycobacteroides abscessus]RIS29725.1 hypothetical protein D2E67_08170 [Mycobacteroides abscessus]RIS92155.1 hypothetical protein D2E64_27145 [Mycobacteroides abscessus]